MLASSVSSERISKSLKEIAAFGPVDGQEAACRVGAWADTQLGAARLAACERGKLTRHLRRSRKGAPEVLDAPPPRRTVILTARLSDQAGLPAVALLETARVLQAVRDAGQFKDDDLRICFEIESSCVKDYAAKPFLAAANETLVAEIRFGEIDLLEPREACSLVIEARDGPRPAVVNDVESVLAQFKGERGFWRESEVRSGSESRGDGVPRIVIGAAKPRPRPESGPTASAPSRKDLPAAVRAARFALVLVAHFAEHKR
jgi:hypothetical protein